MMLLCHLDPVAMQADTYLDGVRHEFRRLKELAERGMAQTSDEDFFEAPTDADNSIAIIVKHIAGNMRSRWTHFLTTDGEKADRNRDSEFVIASDDSRSSLMRRWEEGWQLLFNTLEALKSADLDHTVTIRGEPFLVGQAINRALTHYAYHVGQIVYLARHYAGDHWKSLSVPKGQSEQFNQDPEAYL